jgi:hypothetical protein
MIVERVNPKMFENESLENCTNDAISKLFDLRM